MSTSKKKVFLRLGAGAMLALGSAAAMAGSTGGAAAVGVDAFDGFRDTVIGWAQGPLGTGLAVTMMLVGAGMGIARNSPMPALSGIAGAAFLNWGPGIIESLTNGGLV